MDKFKELFGEEATPALIQEKLEAAVSEVNKQVQGYKHMDVTLVRYEEFPKNTSKKIKRYGLEELLMDDYREKTMKL